MLPALADVDAFVVRLGRDLTEAETARVGALLEDASTLVRDAAGITWVDDDEDLVDDIPDTAVLIVLTAARRAFENPEGVAQKSVDDVSVSYTTGGRGGLYLLAEERALLGRLTGGTSGLWTLSTTREEYGLDQYLEVVGSEPIPFLPPGA